MRLWTLRSIGNDWHNWLSRDDAGNNAHKRRHPAAVRAWGEPAYSAAHTVLRTRPDQTDPIHCHSCRKDSSAKSRSILSSCYPGLLNPSGHIFDRDVGPTCKSVVTEVAFAC